MKVETRSTKLPDGDVIVWDFGDYFLRDDRRIREGTKTFEGIEEAYSLFRKGEQYGRVVVLGGPLSWALERVPWYIDQDRRRILQNACTLT